MGTFKHIGMISVLGTWRTRLLTELPKTRLRSPWRTGLIRQLLTYPLSQRPLQCSCFGIRSWLQLGHQLHNKTCLLTTLWTYVCQASSLKRFRKCEWWLLHWGTRFITMEFPQIHKWSCPEYYSDKKLWIGWICGIQLLELKNSGSSDC